MKRAGYILAFTFVVISQVLSADPFQQFQQTQTTLTTPLASSLAKLIDQVESNPNLLSSLIYNTQPDSANKAVGIQLFEKEGNDALSLVLYTSGLAKKEMVYSIMDPHFTSHLLRYTAPVPYPQRIPLGPLSRDSKMTETWDISQTGLATTGSNQQSFRSSFTSGPGYSTSTKSYRKTYSYDSRTSGQLGAALNVVPVVAQRPWQPVSGKAPDGYVFLFASKAYRQFFKLDLEEGWDVGLPFEQTPDLTVTEEGEAWPQSGYHQKSGVPYVIVRRVQKEVK